MEPNKREKKKHESICHTHIFFLHTLNFSSFTLGIARSSSIDIFLILTVLDIGRDDIDVGVEEHARVAVGAKVGEDVLAAGANLLELDRVAELSEVLVQVRRAGRLVLGDARDGDETLVEVEELLDGFFGGHC